jgi:hypothetical protein
VTDSASEYDRFILLWGAIGVAVELAATSGNWVVNQNFYRRIKTLPTLISPLFTHTTCGHSQFVQNVMSNKHGIQ